MVPNEKKEWWHYLTVKKLSALLHGITSKHKSDFFVWFVVIYLEQKNLNLMKKHVKVKIFCAIVKENASHQNI